MTLGHFSYNTVEILFVPQIKADIETKGDFINDLIQKVLTTCFSDMEDVMKFVDWLDSELATLVTPNSSLTK